MEELADVEELAVDELAVEELAVKELAVEELAVEELAVEELGQWIDEDPSAFAPFGCSRCASAFFRMSLMHISFAYLLCISLMHISYAHLFCMLGHPSYACLCILLMHHLYASLCILLIHSYASFLCIIFYETSYISRMHPSCASLCNLMHISYASFLCIRFASAVNVAGHRARAGPLARRLAVMRGTPTAWTVLEHDGPAHLGLWYTAPPGHQLALIASGCVRLQGRCLIGRESAAAQLRLASCTAVQSCVSATV